jgi:hypothetical protein
MAQRKTFCTKPSSFLKIKLAQIVLDLAGFASLAHLLGSQLAGLQFGFGVQAGAQAGSTAGVVLGVVAGAAARVGAGVLMLITLLTLASTALLASAVLALLIRFSHFFSVLAVLAADLAQHCALSDCTPKNKHARIVIAT